MKKSKFNLRTYLKSKALAVNKHLDKILPKASEYPKEIHRAMRYTVFSGGKRIRPIFCLASCEATGGKDSDAIDVACALELIHNYSLIHDDLPALDNDDMRRGKPTSHKKFSESTAILAGDGLLTLAFNAMSKESSNKRKLKIINEISHAISTYGMIGGQVVDLELKDKEVDFATLEYVNIHKTGMLIAISLKAGAISAGANESQVKKMYKVGEYIGLIFQIVDDILDNEGYVKLFGRQRAYLEASRLAKKAKKIIEPLDKKGQALGALLDFTLNRKY